MNQTNRTLEDIHRDVDFANRYRLEYIKHLMSIAAGIFVISITFMKDFVGNYGTAIFKMGLVAGWGCLVMSIVSGIGHMKCWDRYYISYRKQREEGDRRRKRINLWRIISETLQISFFIAGLVLIFSFSVMNLMK